MKFNYLKNTYLSSMLNKYVNDNEPWNKKLIQSKILKIYYIQQ